MELGKSCFKSPCCGLRGLRWRLALPTRDVRERRNELDADQSSTFHSVEERLQRLEDINAINQIIAAYGPVADTCDREGLERLWHADSTYEIGGIGVFEGPEGIAEAYAGEFHSTIVKHGSAHISSTPHIAIRGDKASAKNYGTLFWHENGQFICGRLTATRWELERGGPEGWQVMKRTTILLDGREEARALLASPL